MPNDRRTGDAAGRKEPKETRMPSSNGDSESQERSGIFDHGFDAYRTVTSEDYRLIFSSGLIVIDANVLLDLYRYHPGTRQQLLDVFDRLRDRLWVPNQAMAEFWANRESVIEDAGDITGTVGDLSKIADQYLSRVRQWINSAGLQQRDSEDLLEITETAFTATVEKISSLAGDKLIKISEDTATDPVVKQLNSILEGHVGNPLLLERRRTAINEEAPQRFADKRPPGYMDANKKNGNSVGDYLIWVEMLQEATRLQADVLFVTSDTKEDWWRIERGQAKGPHPQLVEEMGNVASVRLFMLRPASLLKHAGELLKIKISPESVEDAQRVTAATRNPGLAEYGAIEREVVQKLVDSFGASAVLAGSMVGTSGARRYALDAEVRLPGKAPIFFEIKYIYNSRATVRIITETLRRIAHMASLTGFLGILIVILSDDYETQDVELARGIVERQAMEFSQALYKVYVARRSDFIDESTEDLSSRFMPPDYHDLQVVV